MKAWKENPVLLCLTLFAVLRAESFRTISLILAGILWFMRTDFRTAVKVVLFCVLCCIPRWSTDLPSFTEGTAVIVNGRYSVLQNGNERLLVYTKEPLHLDSVYTVNGVPERISGQKSFFSFSFAEWAARQGICYSTDSSVNERKEGTTIRRQLQKMIEDKQGQEKAMYERILLNITTEEGRDLFRDTGGLSYTGILAAADLLLKYFVDEKKRKYPLLAVNAVLGLIYHWPLLLVESLVFRLLRLHKMDAKLRTGTGLTLTMVLMPSCVFSSAFLIPALFRLGGIFRKNRKLRTFLCISILQSMTGNAVNPIFSIAYRYLRVTLGCIWILAIVSLIIPLPFFQKTVLLVSAGTEKLSAFAIPGNCLGAGMLFFLLLSYLFSFEQYGDLQILAMFYVFLFTGLFHPFAEVSFINVGQGDSILIRSALNRTNILVDTGKPVQQRSLEAFLQAKGIQKLDMLIITHGDDDHCGNQEYVQENYQPAEIVTGHVSEQSAGDFVLYDLNIIESEDENDSSIVTYFSLNGIKFLLMGDCSSNAEEEIVERYGNLEADVVKLSHHGSKTGSCDRFLNCIRPKLAVISSGPYSVYHHPSEEVIQRLLERHIPWMDTKEEGDISILCTPFGNLLISSEGKIAIINTYEYLYLFGKRHLQTGDAAGESA